MATNGSKGPLKLKAYFTGEAWKQEIQRRLRPALVLGLGAGLVFGLLNYFGAFAAIENKTLDWRFLARGPRPVDPADSVVIVAIDDQSFDALKLRWPWPRSIFARAIDNLSEAGAVVVAFDFTFSEASRAERADQDRILGNAIERSRSWVVMGSKFAISETPFGEQVAYVAPVPTIDPGKTHVGYVNLWADADGVIRHAALLKRHQNQTYLAFTLKILDRFLKFTSPYATLTGQWLDFGGLAIPMDVPPNLLVNFRGGAGSYRVVSFWNLLDEDAFQQLRAKGAFRNKIVLIGPTFEEAQDAHSTPFSADFGPTPGVEIHANILTTVLQKNYLWRLPGATSFLLILLLAVLTTFITIRLRPLFALIFLALALPAYGEFARWAFTAGRIVLPVVNPILALIVGTIAVMTYRVLTEERRSRQIKTIFSRYVSPKVVEELVKNPRTALTLGGKKQVVTVLFSDIRSFTSMSEQMQPEAVVELLNEYFQAMTDVIFAYEGTVDKFIGDAIMAIFGAPVAHPDDPIRAVRAGMEMLQILEAMNRNWSSLGRRTFNIGVGINTGEAIVGNMGSTQAMGYTVIGDTVNLASRLEGLNKELQTSLLISENTYALVKDKIRVKAYSGIHVKGKAQAMEVYEVLEVEH